MSLFKHLWCRKNTLWNCPASFFVISSLSCNDLAFLFSTGTAVADYVTVMMTQNAPQSEKTADLRSVHTSNLPALFDQLRISLIVSTYQAGKVIVVRNDHGRLNTHFRTFSSRWASSPTQPG